MRTIPAWFCVAGATLVLSASLLAQQPPAPAVPAGQAAAARPDGAILPELNKPVTVQFLATPLGKALETLSGFITVPMVVDKDKLSMDFPVTLDIKNIPFQTVMNQLKKLGLLDFEFREGVVFVTSKNELFRQRMVSRVYDVRALVSSIPDFNDSPELPSGSYDYESRKSGGSALFGGPASGIDVSGMGASSLERVNELVTLITETVDKENWSAAGGSASIRKLGSLLIVNTIPETQKQIAEMLDDMHKAFGKTLSLDGRYLLIKTTVLDKLVSEKGKGTLILDAKSAEELLLAAGKGEGDIKIVGTARTVCFNGQRVWIAANTDTLYEADLTPVVAEGIVGLDPTIQSFIAGTILDAEPVTGGNDEWITMVVRATCTSSNGIRPLENAFLGEGSTQPKINGTVTIPVAEKKAPTTNKAEGTATPEPIRADMCGTITPPRRCESAKSILELPSYEGFQAKTMVKVPNGGAVLLSGSSTETRKMVGEGHEIVLFLRATVNK